MLPSHRLQIVKSSGSDPLPRLAHSSEKADEYCVEDVSPFDSLVQANAFSASGLSRTMLMTRPQLGSSKSGEVRPHMKIY